MSVRYSYFRFHCRAESNLSTTSLTDLANWHLNKSYDFRLSNFWISKLQIPNDTEAKRYNEICALESHFELLQSILKTLTHPKTTITCTPT